MIKNKNITISIAILSIMIAYLLKQSNGEISIPYLIGTAIGLFLLPLIFTYIFSFILKFSKTKQSENFTLITYSILYFFFLFAQVYNNRNDATDKELISTFKQFVIASTEQRKEYRMKLATIENLNLSDGKFMKDLIILNKIKNQLTIQQAADEWNYNEGMKALKIYHDKFQDIYELNKTDNAKIMADAINFTTLNNNRLQELISSEKEYLAKYGNFIDFLIDNQNSINFENGQVIVSSKIALQNYTDLFNSYLTSEKKFSTSQKGYYSMIYSKVTDLNSKVKFSEVTEFAKLFQEYN